jgi:type III pantothenate kinase
VYGYLAMVEGMVARMRVELGEPDTRVIVTGGRAALLAHESRVIEVVDPDLMLEGLRVIYEMNTGQ